MWTWTFLLFAALAVASMFRVRLAYVAFVVLGVLWMPLRAGFQFDPRECETSLSLGLAVHSLTNYKHILLFAMFSLMTLAQLNRQDPKRLLKLILIVLAMTAIVEGEQSLLGVGHCRVRDLIPNGAGTVIGAVLFEVTRVLRRRRREAEA